MPLDLSKTSESFRRLNPGLLTDKAPAVRTAPDYSAPENVNAAREMCDASDAPRMEKDLLKACMNELCRRGIYAVHLSPKAREKVGLPDIVFPHPIGGRFMAVELKTKTGKVRTEQIEAIEQINNCGGTALVVRSYAEFLEVLE